jgi:hypothetical protein
MALVFILAMSFVIVALAGIYLGPGLGYYGAGSLCFLLLLAILYRVTAGARPEIPRLSSRRK